MTTKHYQYLRAAICWNGEEYTGYDSFLAESQKDAEEKVNYWNTQDKNYVYTLTGFTKELTRAEAKGNF